MLIKKSVFDSVNGFDEMLLSSQDWDLWIKLTKVTAISTCSNSRVFYCNNSKLKISNDLQKKYKGLRFFFLKNKYFIDRNYVLFELLIYRARYYKQICISNMLILLRIFAYQSSKILSLARVIKVFFIIFK